MEKQLCLLFWICIVLLILYSLIDKDQTRRKTVKPMNDEDSLLVIIVVRNGNAGILDSLFQMADDPSCVEVLLSVYKTIHLPDVAKRRRNQVHILHKVDQGTLSEERTSMCEKYAKGRYVLLLHEHVRMEAGWDSKIKEYISKMDVDDILTVHPPSESNMKHGFPIMKEGNLACSPFQVEIQNKDLTPSVLLSPALIFAYEGIQYECKDGDDVARGTKYANESGRNLLTCTSKLIHFRKEPRKWKVDWRMGGDLPPLVSLKTGLTSIPTDKECILKFGSVVEAKREWKRVGKQKMSNSTP